MNGAGFSLAELLVTLVIVSLATSVVALTLRSVETSHVPTRQEVLRAARSDAIRGGHYVVVAPEGANSEPVLFLPDGRTLGPHSDSPRGWVPR